MLIQKDNFLISVTDTVERPLLYGENGVPLIIDTDYHPKEHRKQIGRICGLPIQVTDQYLYDNPLKIGDSVLYSHLALEDLQKYKDKIYRVEYEFIIAKVNNNVIEPLEDFILCEAMTEKNDSLIQKAERSSEKYCKAIAVSNKAKTFGVKVNDIIFFTHNANYSFKVGEKEFVRLRIRNVIAIERGGELFPMRNKVMVSEINKEENVLGIVVLKKKTNQKKGVVLKASVEVKEIKQGDEIAYYLGSSSSLTWNGNQYAFVNKDNIKFIYGKS